MREYEWTGCQDVGAMLRFLTRTRSGESIPTADWRISQEEVKLFDEACFVHFGLTIDEVGEQEEVVVGAADALRCIRGNPWRELETSRAAWVNGPACKTCDGLGWYNEIGPNTFPQTCWQCGGEGHKPVEKREPEPWFTPTVRMLVESLTQKCGNCKGSWRVKVCPAFMYSCYEFGDECRCSGAKEEVCVKCKGVLDPVAVLALADALEEAGCPTDHPCTHVVGMPKGPGGQMMPACRKCDGGYGPHPLLEHLRGPGPHYAGCHAVRALGGWK